MTVPRPDVEKPTLNTPSDLAGKQGEISNANGVTVHLILLNLPVPLTLVSS